MGEIEKKRDRLAGTAKDRLKEYNTIMKKGNA